MIVIVIGEIVIGEIFGYLFHQPMGCKSLVFDNGVQFWEDMKIEKTLIIF